MDFFQQILNVTFLAPLFLLCMIILGIFLRLFRTEKTIIYQLQLSTVGLSFTLILWAFPKYPVLSLEYPLLFLCFFLLIFILTYLFNKPVRVLILCILYIISIYYYRGRISNYWDSFIYLSPLQFQLIKGIDIVTSDVNRSKPFFIRLLNLTSYLGTPVNVNNLYYVRYRDWISHIENFNGLPKIRDQYPMLLKRIGLIAIWLIAWYFWEPVFKLFTARISQNNLVISIAGTVFILLIFWPLLNHILFLGANWLNTPGIELCRTPILTTSPIDFWRRQQLGIATFFREKVYNETWGGERPPKYRNLIYTFVLIGLWHALTYQWAVWGVLWGIVMVVNRFYRQTLKPHVIRVVNPVPWCYSIVCWSITILILTMLNAVTVRDPILPNFITQLKTQEFRLEGGRGFSVTIPSTLKGDTPQSIDMPFGKVIIHTYKSDSFDGNVICIDFPPDYVRQNDPHKLFDYVLNSMIGISKERRLNETSLSFNGNPGREFEANTVKDGEVCKIKARVFQVGNRYYTIICLIPRSRMVSNNIGIFQSFKLLDR